MSFDPSALHFLRPGWLLAIVPVLVVGAVLLRRQDVVARWSEVIAPHLLEHLVVQPRRGSRIRPVHLLIAVGVVASVALAGPSWRREAPPFTEDTAPLVVVMDLSDSMRVSDVQPSRFARSQQKVRDLLESRAGARTGLVAFAGSAHVVLPPTDDAGVVEAFVTALEPGIMPRAGKEPSAALVVAAEMLANEEIPGTILFLTDGIASDEVEAFVDHEAQGSDQVGVWAVGTERGGLIPEGDGVERAGELAVLDRPGLDTLRRETSAFVVSVTVDDSDVDRVARGIETHLAAVQEQDASGRWRDEGYWLVWPLMALSLAWFRKGWVVLWE